MVHCYGDLWLLDTQSMTWSQPGTSGTKPAPRAGAALLLGRKQSRSCSLTATLSPDKLWVCWVTLTHSRGKGWTAQGYQQQ